MKRHLKIIFVWTILIICLQITISQTYAMKARAAELEISVDKTDSGLQLHDVKSAYLMDYTTETPIYVHNECARLPIASMCKIMTLILAFEAIDAGDLQLDEEVMISEQAAGMGGSQVFLDCNVKYPVKELIKSIVVCSANDSCVAIAERIAGSETLFTEKMNEKAKELGLNDTLFANCTGLPKEPQYSCAKDVAIMLKTLLKYPNYYQFGSVWMDKFQHTNGRYTEISNTNKLVKFYDGCDGGKTGFTNQAGFCLAATAKRNDMRIIAVSIGSASSKDRFNAVRNMFDYAFANYCVKPLAEANVALVDALPVVGGREKTLQVCPQNTAFAFMKRGEPVNYHTQLSTNKLVAPIRKGEKIGELLVYKNSVEVERIPVISMQDIEKATWFDCLKDVANGWNARR